MILGNCTFSSVSANTVNDLDCPSFTLTTAPTYTGTGQVYRAGFLGDDGAYYVSQDLFFTFLIWF